MTTAKRGGRVALCAVALGGVALASAARAQPASPPATTSAPVPPATTVVPPKLASEETVAYPPGAHGDASVVLVVVVGEDGRARSVTVERGETPFADAAREAVSGWSFEPAKRDGKTIRAKIRLEVVFREPRTIEVPPASEPTPEPPPLASPRRPVIQDVRVQGTKAEPSRTVSLERSEVRQIPGAFGDPFRALEIMPGVTPIVSGLPFFFVRGAPPGNVGYYLDGVRVPLLFHVGAGPSVIHPALIDRVDLYPGGYPARFGRFSGGIVAGETNEPSTALRGEYNVRLFDAGAMVETPFASGRGSALLAGRYSYTAALLSRISPDTSLDYWDYQARVGYSLTPEDRVSVFAFGSYDFLGQRTQRETLTVFGTEFHRVDLRYDHRIPAGNLRVAVTGGIDRSRLQENRFTRDKLVGARTELVRRLSKAALFRAGTDLQTDSYDIEIGDAELTQSASRVSAFFPSRTDLAFGTRADVVLAVTDRLDITPGLRVDFWSSQGKTALAADPRFAMRTEVTDRMRLVSAMGLAHQTPAFVVPVPGFQPGGLRGGLQKSLQESLGVEVDVADATTLTATVFHNGFFDMSDPLGVSERVASGCAPGQFPADSLAGDYGFRGSDFPPPCGEPRFPPGTIGPDRSGGGGQAADSEGGRRAATAFEVRTRGSAYGLELFLKRKLTRRLGGFLSYTLSRSTRSYGTRTFVATFDRTHVGNAAIAFDLGKNWRAGTRLVFYTGLPKAPDPQGRDDDTRLPPFFRVDLRLEKRWQLGQKAWIAAVAEWMNATLSKEAVSTRCTLQGCESQTIGPVTIPSLGVEGGF